MKPYWQTKKRRVFKRGEVAMVNINGFHFAGRFLTYVTMQHKQAIIEFPSNTGMEQIICKKAQNNNHWNPIDKSVF